MRKKRERKRAGSRKGLRRDSQSGRAIFFQISMTRSEEGKYEYSEMTEMTGVHKVMNVTLTKMLSVYYIVDEREREREGSARPLARVAFPNR